MRVALGQEAGMRFGCLTTAAHGLDMGKPYGFDRYERLLNELRLPSRPRPRN